MWTEVSPTACWRSFALCCVFTPAPRCAADNKLEFRELEMVVMAMDPHHVLTHDDMQYLWQVLNPEG